jgi:hypothetical protein
MSNITGAGMQGRKASEAQREAFLAALRRGVSVKVAAASARVHRVTAYKWRENDAAFRRAWEEAVEEGTGRAAEEALRRGMALRAAPAATLAECSDKDLTYVLRARRPSQYCTPTVFEAPEPPDLAERMEAARKRVWG